MVISCSNFNYSYLCFKNIGHNIMKNLLFFLLCSVLLGCIFADCPGNFAKFQDDCYRYVKIQADYDEAKELCELVNATLASINSKEEQNFIGSLFEGGPGDEWGWIDLTENLVFEWSDGSSPSWLISQSAFQPKVTRCVQMWSNKLWNLQQHLDYLISDCSAKSGGAICKRSAS